MSGVSSMDAEFTLSSMALENERGNPERLAKLLTQSIR
jgi:hypothetical protein